ncbi:hypothetical protein [Rhizobium oryzicola]|uniref:PIN domain-containing protein n=1 Tax=Rhizobium oryzicola TaxID=1232668 RepID=A0ABT8SYY3_9HYPH|nr:hypothetical protein [Rhizobium oryzicola]MDO1583618.1 hypothetical protein [Rhizobium oryzicola]
MKYLITACVLSEFSKRRPKLGLLNFFERSQIAIPFGTCLTIERGLEALSKRDACKAAELRKFYEELLTGVEVIGNRDRDIARVLARILDHAPLRNTWLPNERAKLPSYGHYPMVAAASIVTELPIAAVKTRDLERIDSVFPLPGIFNPALMLHQMPSQQPYPPTSAAAPPHSSAAE